MTSDQPVDRRVAAHDRARGHAAAHHGAEHGAGGDPGVWADADRAEQGGLVRRSGTEQQGSAVGSAGQQAWRLKHRGAGQPSAERPEERSADSRAAMASASTVGEAAQSSEPQNSSQSAGQEGSSAAANP